MEKPRRILVRGVNWLGDAVMTTPALLRLREAHPPAHIALLAQGKLAELWRGHEAVNEVIVFEKAHGTVALAKRLRAGQFDTALVLPNSFRSAFEVWLAGIPRRAGYGGRGRALLLNELVPRRLSETAMHKRSVPEIKRLIEGTCRDRQSFAQEAHQLFDYLHLAAALGAKPEAIAPRLFISEEEKTEFRARWNIGAKGPILGLNPGAEYGPAKRWPADRFIEAARLISTQVKCEWLIFGGKADTATASEIETALRGARPDTAVLNLSGMTNLRELCAGLSLCEAVLTNDTGPMHLAAALGAKVVVPFGSTSPELTGPGLPGDKRHRLLLGQAQCAPCFRRECPVDFRCMLSIPPEAACEAVLSLLRRG